MITKGLCLALGCPGRHSHGALPLTIVSMLWTFPSLCVLHILISESNRREIHFALATFHAMSNWFQYLKLKVSASQRNWSL